MTDIKENTSGQGGSREIKFKIMPIFKLDRGSPFVVSIPYHIRDRWYKYNIDMNIAQTPLYRDTDETIGCKAMSPDHLKAIVEWRDEIQNNLHFTPTELLSEK